MINTEQEMETMWEDGKWFITRGEHQGRPCIVLHKYPGCNGIFWVWQASPNCYFSSTGPEDSGLQTDWSMDLVEGCAPPFTYKFVMEKLGDKEQVQSWVK